MNFYRFMNIQQFALPITVCDLVLDQVMKCAQLYFEKGGVSE